MSDVEIKIKVDGAQAETNLKKLEKAGVDAAKNITLGFNSTTSSLKVMGGIISANVVMGAFRELKNIAIDMFSTFVDEASRLEVVKQQFATLTGSLDTATELVNGLREAAAKTPFEIKGLQDSARLLLATGTHVNSVIPLLLKLGDAAAVGANDILGLTTVFGKIQGQGKVTAETFETLINQAPVLADALVKAAGVSGVGSLRRAMSDGQVTADVFMKSLDIATQSGGKAFEGMTKQSSTLSGKLSNLKDNFTNIAGDLGTLLLPSLKKLTDSFNELIAKNKEPILKAISAKVINPISSGISNLADELNKGNDPFESWIKNFLELGELLATTVILIGVLAIKKGLESLLPVLLDVQVAFSNFLDKLVVIANYIASFLPSLETLGGYFSRGAIFVSDYSLALVQLTRALTSVISVVWSSSLNKDEDAVLRLRDSVQNSLTPLKDYTSAQQKANDSILNQIGLIDALNGVKGQDIPYAPGQGAVVQEPKEAKKEVKIAEETDLQREILNIREEGKLADEERLLYMQDLHQQYLDNVYSGELSYSEKEQALKRQAIENTIKDKDKLAKRLAQQDVEGQKLNLSNQRQADQQLISLKQQTNQSMIAGSFMLAQTIGQIATKSAGAQFAIQQGLAIAQATVNAFMASSMALAAPPGPPWTIPASHAAFALGMTNVGFIAAVTFLKGISGNYAEGGIVPGSSFSGDRVPAMVNSGEMILNKKQQSNLLEKASGAGGDNSSLINSIISLANRPVVLEINGKEIAHVVREQIKDGFVLQYV